MMGFYMGRRWIIYVFRGWVTLKNNMRRAHIDRAGEAARDAVMVQNARIMFARIHILERKLGFDTPTPRDKEE